MQIVKTNIFQCDKILAQISVEKNGAAPNILIVNPMRICDMDQRRYRTASTSHSSVK